MIETVAASTIVIREASALDVERVAVLFDAYRQFYERPSDLAAATAFIRERLSRAESIVLLAERTKDGGACACGFAQVYPRFSSLQLARVHVLNDLYVEPSSRGVGVGRRLVAAAHRLARTHGAAALELATHHTNVVAKGLYQRYGFVREDEFEHYTLAIETARPQGDA